MLSIGLSNTLNLKETLEILVRDRTGNIRPPPSTQALFHCSAAICEFKHSQPLLSCTCTFEKSGCQGPTFNFPGSSEHVSKPSACSDGRCSSQYWRLRGDPGGAHPGGRTIRGEQDLLQLLLAHSQAVRGSISRE